MSQHNAFRAALAGLIMLGLVACSGNTESAEDAQPATTTTIRSTPAPTTGTSAPAPTTTTTTVSEAGPTDLCQTGVTSPTRFDPADGVHHAYLTAIDEAGRNLSFDMIQWIDDEEQPNGYRIENVNPMVRRATVASDAGLVVLRYLTEVQHLVAVDFEGLAARLAESPRPDEGTALSWSPYLLMFRDGTISGVCEVYIP